MRQGGVTRAPGTIYRGRTKNDALARLVPFEFNSDDALTLEFTDLTMRVWRYGELIDDGGSPYELTTPFEEQDLENLDWVQSGDAIYMVDGRNPPQRLIRSALDDWAIEDAEFDCGPFRVQNLDEAITVQASGTTGTITLTGVGDPFSAEMVDGLIQLQPEDYTSISLWEGNATVTAGDKMRYDGNIYEVVSGMTTGVNPPTHSEGEQQYSNAGIVWRFVSDGTGIARITSYTNANSVAAEVLKPLPEAVVDDPTYRWSEGAWSEKNGFPSSIEIFEQRMVLAGTPTDPRTVWFSTIGAYRDFTPSIDADGAFGYAIAGGQSLNRILWLRAGRTGLHVGALGEEYSSRSSDSSTVIGPTTAIFRLDSSNGSKPVRPIAPDGKPIFVAKDGARVFELAYAFDQDANLASELSVAADHLGSSGYSEIVWQSAPLRTAWLRRGDGELVALLYDPQQDVIGWATYPLAGGQCEALSVSIGADASSDVLTAVVQRTIDGELRRHIEEQSITYGVVVGDDGIDTANHLFAAVDITASSPTDTFDVPHLIGQEVVAWTDQGEFSPLTVSDAGTVTLGEQVSHAIIGINEPDQRVALLDQYGPARDGSSIGRKTRVHRGSGVVLHKTAAAQARTIERELGYPERLGEWWEILGRPVAGDLTVAYSGAAQLDIVTGFHEGVSLEFAPIGAAPMTILAVVPRLEEAGA